MPINYSDYSKSLVNVKRRFGDIVKNQTPNLRKSKKPT